MSDEIRYEVGEEIAQGDFATVYRGRDLRLDRDVAIKQLHQEYLNNRKLTERYWQEAQILARLEHPHVMTIYDVVPEKGWLILELMKGSLKDQLGNRPIHLKDLRLTILFVARALSFFQQHDILHGDVKPSNLLIGRNNVIKLGDFGIARRLQSGEGSAIKGATRYIAPEVVSDNFGPVGPHSDIYSLGFSAYELLCGERFESLFPGLHMFGRDQQLAWIMWHSAIDRRLPRIKDVLEGVPEQLAAVIEKMTEKDPAKRYRSADQIIADLSSKTTIPPTEESQRDLAETERAARGARRKRYAAIGAILASLLLSAFMLLPNNREPSRKSPRAPTEGWVGKVVADQDKIYLKSEEEVFIGENDLILLNGTVCELDDLQVNDKLSIQQYFDGAGGQAKRIEVTRVEATGFSGRITNVDATERTLAIAGDGDESRFFSFDGETPVRLNGESVTAAKLKAGDTATVKYRRQGEGTHAVSIDAQRELTTSGTLEGVDVANGRITFSRNGTETTMRVADDCTITINGRDTLAGRSPSLGDLQSGDRIVALVHDAEARRIELEREISDVVEVSAVQAAEDRLTVVVEGDQMEVSTEKASVAYEDGRMPLSSLRKGDVLVVTHGSPDRRNVSARSIEVRELVRDPRLAALVICHQSYDNIQVTPYQYGVRDAELVRDALDVGARVPPSQLVLLKDLSRNALLEEITGFLAAQGTREQLMVYYVGQAYVEPKTDTTYLAPRDFELDNMAQTGLRLRDLIERMESFQAREKLLILDTCHDVSAVESQLQPATGDQIRTAMVGHARSRSVTLIGSCDDERRVVVDEDGGHGRFARELSKAFGGDADFDTDHQVTGDELFTYLREQLTAVQQTPVRFQPDRSPPRLKPEAAAAVRNLLAKMGQRRVSAQFNEDYERAKELCGKEPDANLAYALVKLKTGRTGESLDVFQAVLASHPDSLVAYHAAAYQHLGKKEWGAAADLLAEVVKRIDALSNPRGDYISHLLRFAGIARPFLDQVEPGSEYGEVIEPAAEKLHEDQQREYAAGRREFDARLEQLSPARRGSIRGFYQFDFEMVKEYLLKQLN